MIALRAAATLAELRGSHTGAGAGVRITHLARPHEAEVGALAPLLSARFIAPALAAHARGAALLVDATLAGDARLVALRSQTGDEAAQRLWIQPNASWALADLLDACDAPEAPATWGEGTMLGPNVVLGPRVRIGARVRIDANTVIGRPGFGWAFGEGGRTRAIPQLGGVIIEDDVVIGPLCTIDAGTLAPTRIRRGAKLDAQVHVGHNGDIGEGCIIAAQAGFAGSVVLGAGVLVGGQAGIADHVEVGAGARIAAKSGVIGDVPAGAVVAGYPAVPRVRWLRGLARLYRDLARPKTP